MPPANPLLRLPAAGDNAAMQTEPPKADSPKRKRRWFQFSLRSLMIGVTLFCVAVGGYIGWQAKIVRERKAMLAQLSAADWRRPEFRWHSPTPQIPWLRRILGDKPVAMLVVPPNADQQAIAEIRQMLPEADLALVRAAHDYYPLPTIPPATQP